MSVGLAGVRAVAREAWRLRWLLLLNAYLLSPLAVSAILQRRSDLSLKLMLFTVLASLGWLLALQTTFRRPLVAHALLGPLYVVVAADLFVIVLYDTRLTSSMLSVIFENLADAPEYLRLYLRPVVIGLGATVGFYVLGMVKIRRLELRPHRLVPVAGWAAMVVMYTGIYVYVNDLPHLAAADRSTPFGVFPQSYLAWEVYNDVLGQRERTKDFKFGATREAAPPAPETYVLVIGESNRADHWALYGYPRDTNPRLAKQANLLAFRDVVSQAAFTKAAVPFIITRGSTAKPEVVSKEKSIVSVFGELGFQTGWFSTQTRDPFTGAINRFSGEAVDQRFVERQHDEALIDMLRSALGAAAAQPRRFYVVHAMGSHFSTQNRYPRSFAVFPDAEGPGVSEHDALINSYDDSILYMDFVLDEMIGALRATGGVATLLYVADHGENLRDDSRQLFGHFLNNEYDLPVPLLFWYSDAWAAQFPDKLAAARRVAGEKLSTQAVFHSLVDMAGASVHDPDTRVLSVFSSGWAPRPRLITSEHGTFDYDEFLQAVRAKRAVQEAAPAQ